MVRLLLEAGVDINDINTLGETALHKAAFDGSEQIVRALLTNIAHTDIPAVNGEHAIDYTVRQRVPNVYRTEVSHLFFQNPQVILRLREGST